MKWPSNNFKAQSDNGPSFVFFVSSPAPATPFLAAASSPPRPPVRPLRRPSRRRLRLLLATARRPAPANAARQLLRRATTGAAALPIKPGDSLPGEVPPARIRGLTRAGKRASEMALNAGGGTINWFPGHMAAASRAIRDRLKLADLVIEVRDARIPLSSANEDLQPVLTAKRRILALNKKDLANPNIMNMWLDHFESSKQDCISINAHSSNSINQLLGLVELKLREAILKEPTLIVMVVGVPNVGKSALINAIHRIASSRFPVNDKIKRATVGPLPGVTQDIAGYKIASQPSIYVLDTPGVLVPSIPDMETGLKLALTGAVKDSVVGEERIAKYLLSLLNIRKTPLHWERLVHRRAEFDEETGGNCEKGSRDSLRRRRVSNSDAVYVQDMVMEVQRTLCSTSMEFTGNLDEDNELESLIEAQLVALRKVFRIPHKPLDESHGPASKKLLTLFRAGKLGPFILDDLPGQQ